MSAVLQSLLDAELRRAPEHHDAERPSCGPLPPGGGAYSNHLPMALQALAALGASDARLQAWAGRAFAGVPLQGVWPALETTESRLRQALHQGGAAALLAHHLPTLMPGCGAMAFHALIRTAHAWEAGHQGQLLRALAYWRERSAPLPGPVEAEGEGEGEGEHLALDDWLAALLRLPPPEAMNQPWISVRMLAAASSQAFQQLAPRLCLDADLLPRLARRAAAAYAGSGNFTLLHLLTATRALGVLLPLLPAPARDAALRAFSRQAAAALLASRWRGALQVQPEPADWHNLRAAAIAHDDAHAIKLVHAAWQLGQHDADPVWRQAAARALQGFGSQG